MPRMTVFARISLLVCAMSAWFLYGTGHAFLFEVAVVNTLIYFWSFGVMDNFAREKYLELGAQEWKYMPHWVADVVKKREADAVPNWLATVNFVSALIGVALFIFGISISIKTV